MTGPVFSAITTSMNEKSKRLRRAIKITTILAIALAAPISVMIYLRVTRGDSLRDLGEVQPFIVKDRSGNYFDHTQLTNHVTVVALFPKTCEGGSQIGSKSSSEIGSTTCTKMITASAMAGAWLSKNLATEPNKPKAPVQQIAVVPPGQLIGFEDGAGWRTFDHDVFSTQQIVPGDPSLTPPGFYAIDPTRHFRAKFPLDVNGHVVWKDFETALSRMTMNLYFNDYLAKRTFFGPVKESAKPSPP